MGQMGHPGQTGQAGYGFSNSRDKPASMKNILASLEKLVTAKEANQNQTPAEPVSASSASLPCNSPAPPRSDAPTLHDLPISSSRRPNGKVARLPHLIRALVNTMLDDGFTYKAIVSKLEQLGYPGFLEQNISRWMKGGYQSWLAVRRFQSALALLDPQNCNGAACPLPSDVGPDRAHSEAALRQVEIVLGHSTAPDNAEER